jgi:hypothetical protein
MKAGTVLGVDSNVRHECRWCSRELQKGDVVWVYGEPTVVAHIDCFKRQGEPAAKATDLMSEEQEGGE